MKLFLDCDGVLADFDTRALEIFGMPARQYEDTYGQKAFWKTIANHENFYRDLPLMEGAKDLWDATKHLNQTILTGTPQGDWAAPQKVQWAYEHFGHDVRIITCRSRHKRNYMVPNMTNVIVDDWTGYKHLWEEHDGIFIHHKTVEDTLKELEKIGIL